MTEILQFLFVIWLLDRLLVIRRRYKLAIEHNFPDQYERGYWALWIYCKVYYSENEPYTRNGGKRLIFIKYGKKESNKK